VRKIAAVARKELRQAFRDPLTLGLLLGIPTMMLLLYGYAVNFDVRHVKLAVEDRDRSAASRELVDAFVHSAYFDFVADVPPGGDVDRLLERRRARAVLVIPADYGRGLNAGRSVAVQLLLDGTDATTAQTVLGYAVTILGEINARVIGAGRATVVPLSFQPRVWYNPELKSSHFLVPGLIGFILMLTTVLSTALSVVREKERGTMEQLRVAPVGGAEFLVGKTLPYLAISIVATLFILVAARALFGVVIRGPALHLAAATIVYLLGGLGLGLFVSTMAVTQAQAFQFGATVSILPALMLSGFIFPLENMPAPLQALSHVVPARYYLIILRGIILKGADLAPYLRELFFLVLYAAVVIGLAVLRFGRSRGAA
jgi:ABC-2 type transport system permease protein